MGHGRPTFVDKLAPEAGNVAVWRQLRQCSKLVLKDATRLCCPNPKVVDHLLHTHTHTHNSSSSSSS